MRYLIAGGTGFIGTAYTQHLLAAGHEVVILSRSSKPSDGRGVSFAKWDGMRIPSDLGAVDVVVNLAGANVGEKWTPAHKESILRSRIVATQACVNWIQAQTQKPKVFLSASGINYYGGSWEDWADEDRGPGADFMAQVCQEWEKAAEGAGVRTVLLRTGIVFGREAGPLPAMAKPFQMFVGGRLGSGNHHMPWLHLKDWISMAEFLVQSQQLSGPVNLCVPKPIKQREFAKVLGRVLKRPSFWVVPAFVLRLLLGEMHVIVLGNMEAYPEVLKRAGYKFLFTEVEAALRDIYQR